MRYLPPVLIVVLLGAFPDPPGLPPGVKDTQNPKDKPPSPEEAVKRLKLPDGFHATLFAGEPHVHQPISMCWDQRGRLWVAECFSYPDWQQPNGNKPAEGRDRILIFEDTTGAGVFDKRTVFWDKASNLTSILVGDGGVYALCAPFLVFLPDRDGDDVPDGPPQVILDGWTLKAGHNIVSGLTWGPEGWIYGRHGITAESRPGLPSTPEKERPRLNCSIWRYHPTKKLVEVVSNGTTNPWGLDFDDHGQAFFTNSVTGHLWHVVPGAHYERMHGQDYNPYLYELIGSTSDHLHWGGGHWTESRDAYGIHDAAGGGHAHCGAMIYLGDNFPDKYRGQIFMGNIHGNRLNVNLLERQGASYVGKRAPDFLKTDNPWFRPIVVDYGPDGGVYVSDWCDLGECHDYDGVHRSSGRIYKVTYGKPAKAGPIDLHKLTEMELVALQLHKNDWYVRQARRLLAQRAAAGGSMKDVHKALLTMFDKHPDSARKLRALWALYVTGGAKDGWLILQLEHLDEHVRAWAIRLLVDGRQPPAEALEQFQRMADKDPSGLVRLYLASVLQKLPLAERLPIATNLLAHGEDAKDRVLPLMIWYGVEPIVLAHKEQAAKMTGHCKIPKVRQFIARRLTEAAGNDDQQWKLILAMLAKETVPDTDWQRDWLLGINGGLKGRQNVAMPLGWDVVHDKLQNSPSAEVRHLASRVALIFGDAKVVAKYKSFVLDRQKDKFDVGQRTAHLEALLEHRPENLQHMLLELLSDAALRGPALRGLALYDDPVIPLSILNTYPKLTAAEKQIAIATLTSRPKYALVLLDAMEKKQIPRGDVSVFAARQMSDLKNKEVSERLAKVWGTVRSTPGQKKAQIAKYKALLAPEVLAKADPAKGRLVFNKMCGQCHLLFGEGKKIGPDLTGSNRNDLHYVLENMIDPSAVIGKDYQLTNITTKGGRLISGIVVEENEQSLTLQTATERLVVTAAEIDRRQLSNVSMMPEGQLEQMTFSELCDLVRYLGSKEQVPLAK
jgi:putative membrane-bound dehydrogenase-like protein